MFCVVSNIPTIPQILSEQQVRDIHLLRGYNNYTALHHAVHQGHAHLVAELIRHGVPINARNSLGETALHLAAYSGRLLVTEQLLDKGADINAVNNENETPLFYAARKELAAVVRLLLQRNARVDIRDKYGDLAVDHASEKRTIHCFEAGQVMISPRVEEDPHAPSSSSSSSSSDSRGGMPASFSYELLLRTIKFLCPKDVCRAACVAGKWHSCRAYCRTTFYA